MFILCRLILILCWCILISADLPWFVIVFIDFIELYWFGVDSCWFSVDLYLFCVDLFWFMMILLWFVIIDVVFYIHVDSVLIYVDLYWFCSDVWWFMWISVDSYWFCVDYCRFMLILLWFVMICVDSLLIYIDFIRIHVDSCWFCYDLWSCMFSLNLWPVLFCYYCPGEVFVVPGKQGNNFHPMGSQGASDRAPGRPFAKSVPNYFWDLHNHLVYSGLIFAKSAPQLHVIILRSVSTNST